MKTAIILAMMFATAALPSDERGTSVHPDIWDGWGNRLQLHYRLDEWDWRKDYPALKWPDTPVTDA